MRLTTLSYEFDILNGTDFDADTKRAYLLLETK